MNKNQDWCGSFENQTDAFGCKYILVVLVRDGKEVRRAMVETREEAAYVADSWLNRVAFYREERETYLRKELRGSKYAAKTDT